VTSLVTAVILWIVILSHQHCDPLASYWLHLARLSLYYQPIYYFKLMLMTFYLKLDTIEVIDSGAQYYILSEQLNLDVTEAAERHLQQVSEYTRSSPSNG